MVALTRESADRFAAAWIGNGTRATDGILSYYADDVGFVTDNA
ncbi:MAG TPA: hypothetical protein VFE37_20965 [Chloroflexota bacterium]|nr:hypothetical protein [Chloroflexota bacterium]